MHSIINFVEDLIKLILNGLHFIIQEDMKVVSTNCSCVSQVCVCVLLRNIIVNWLLILFCFLVLIGDWFLFYPAIVVFVFILYTSLSPVAKVGQISITVVG